MRSNVIGTCYVISVNENHITMVVPTIYLSKPKRLSKYEILRKFDTVFAAQKFIRQNTLPPVEIEVAA